MPRPHPARATPRCDRPSSTRRRSRTPGDKTTFVPGDRVTVPFKPRKGDRWTVGGVTPRALPAGRLSGKAIRATPDAPAPDRRRDRANRSSRSDRPTCPYLDPTTTFVAQPAAAVDAGALKREVFGFLPYWELTDSSTRLDWEKLSTVAYFGVGALGDGTLQKRNSDGSTTVGWSGWTSSKMTSVINAAHASGARVVLTVQSFAWSSTGVARQKALLGSSRQPAQPRPPDRGGGPRPRRGRRQPRLRADRRDLRRRVHLARPVGPVRAEQGRAGLPADVRHDRLDRQLPDREGDRLRWRGRRRGHGLRLSRRVDQPGRLGRADRRADLRHHRHGGRLHGPHPGLEGHPGRAVLRPRLVDGHPRRSTPRTSRAPRTGRRRPSSTPRPASTPPTTASSATRSRARPGRPTSARTAPRSTAA